MLSDMGTYQLLKMFSKLVNEDFGCLKWFLEFEIWVHSLICDNEID